MALSDPQKQLELLAKKTERAGDMGPRILREIKTPTFSNTSGKNYSWLVQSLSVAWEPALWLRLLPPQMIILSHPWKVSNTWRGELIVLIGSD